MLATTQEVRVVVGTLSTAPLFKLYACVYVFFQSESILFYHQYQYE